MRGIAVAVGVLLLVGGCVSRGGEPSATDPPTTTTMTTTTTTSSRSSTDPAIAVEAAEILARGGLALNDIMCDPPLPPRFPSVGLDYAGTQPAGIDTYTLPMESETVVARLSVKPGLDLMLAVTLRFGTDEWCTYAMTWCPAEFRGLPPLTVDKGVMAAFDEQDRAVLCRG
jgi:hypothetical protein